jgi:hypothetical protein
MELPLSKRICGSWAGQSWNSGPWWSWFTSKSHVYLTSKSHVYPDLVRHAASRRCVAHHLLWQLSLYSCTLSILGPLIASIIFGTNKVGHVFLLHTVCLWLELLSQEILDTLMFWTRKFNPVNFYRLMFRRRRYTETKIASDAHGQVFDVESVVSGDSVLDIRQETKSTDEGQAL